MVLINRSKVRLWRLPSIVLGNDIARVRRCAKSSVEGVKAVAQRVLTYDKRLVMKNLELDAKLFFAKLFKARKRWSKHCRAT